MKVKQSQNAFITGASSGIGAAFARRLASEGYNLVIVARRKQRLEAIAKELQELYSVTVTVMVADLSSLIDIKQIEKHISMSEPLDIVINNAGFGLPGKFVDLDLDKLTDMLHVHMIAPVRLCKAALSGMYLRKRGTIINISSMSGLGAALPYHVVYSASKAFLIAFSKLLRKEVCSAGIKIQVLCPAYTRTEFYNSAESKAFNKFKDRKRCMMSAEEVVSASLAALQKNKTIVIPGFKNRIYALLKKIIPIY